MSRTLQIVIASFAAIILTAVGFRSSLIYMTCPFETLVAWFPFGVIAGVLTEGLVVASVVQFPMFAVAFGFGIQRWRTRNVLVVLAIGYVLAIGIATGLAFWVEKNRRQGSFRPQSVMVALEHRIPVHNARGIPQVSLNLE